MSNTPIWFALGECTLGSVLVAATARGVCAVFLGDNPKDLVDDLKRRFPTAALSEADESFQHTVKRVVGLVQNPVADAGLSLDIQGTAFQQRVWQALRKIPLGSTASYSQVATSIGAVTSSRAVAQACAANPLAVVIPCHRVVRTDGNLSGYRWGVERKRALLQNEAGAAAMPPAPAQATPLDKQVFTAI